jgi:hypothetical protein
VRKELTVTIKATGEVRLFKRTEYYNKSAFRWKTVTETPTREEVSEQKASGGWLPRRVLRDEVRVFGVNLPRMYFPIAALAFGLIGLLLALMPWRWVRWRKVLPAAASGR